MSRSLYSIMRLLGQFQVCFFVFFYKKVLSIKKSTKNARQMAFTLIEVFVHTENVAFVI